MEDRLVSLNTNVSSWKRKYEQATEEYKKLKRDVSVARFMFEHPQMMAGVVSWSAD